MTDVVREFDQLLQGDLVELEVPALEQLSVIRAKGFEGWVGLVTQTCDLVREHPATAAVAPVVRPEADLARQAAKGVLPNLVGVPEVAHDLFLDLSAIVSINKRLLLERPYRRGLNADLPDQTRGFARAVGRKFSRFAFPDPVVPWLRPLEVVIREKAARPRSPIGRFLSDVVQLRVQTDDWDAPRLTIHVHVIFEPGALPEPSGLGLVPASEALNRADFLGTLDQLYGPSPAAGDARLAWFGRAVEALMERTTDEARRRGADPAVVDRLVGVLWSEDDFPLSRYRRSEQLDVDYLSPAELS